MSKFVSIKTNLKQNVHLENALRDLSCEIVEKTHIKTLLNRSHAVDLAVRTPFGTIGFRQSGDSLNLAGDDMLLAKNEGFLKKLTQRYAYHKVLFEASEAGFKLVKETSASGDSIRLVVRKWQ